MLAMKLLLLMAMCQWTVGKLDAVPACAIHCWENTKYISKCSGDIKCQCNELEYVNSVYQCIYSQCDTAHFGAALHHTISQCFEVGNKILLGVPPIPDRELLRRREADVIAGSEIYSSGSAYRFPTNSVNSFLTISAERNIYQTQSVNSYPTQSAGHYERRAVDDHLISQSSTIDVPSPKSPTTTAAILFKVESTANTAATLVPGLVRSTAIVPRPSFVVAMSAAMMVVYLNL